MAKTFELFKMLDIPLLKYNISDGSNWLAYNGIRMTKEEFKKNPKIWAEDPFRVSKVHGGSVPDKWARKNPSELLHEALQNFIEEIVKTPKTGLQKIIDNFDHFSTRSYLSHKGYPPAVINWIETMSYGTGWFDRGLIETVLEQMAFMYDVADPSALEWHCIRGGSEVLPLKMVQWLKANTKCTKIHMRHRVTKVEYKLHELTVSGISHPLVTGDPSFFKQTYSHVIFAIPPPCLRMIDLDTCELDYAQRTAMRSLQLAPSSKIGMKFKTAWWQTLNDNHVGGQSTTDRTARTIVYPSHGDGKSTVLIVSYAWNSLALAAMMHGPGSAEEEERLKQIKLEDLAYVHKIPLKKLADEFEYMFAFDWSSNPLSMGAFGLFGPSQFREFYRHVTRPAARGQMYFVGETFSTTHRWVAGALNSAERGVLQLLQHHRLATHNKGHEEDYIEKFLQKWKPDLEVPKEAIFKQLVASLVIQHDEFDKHQ
ncbi:Flavin containing amine oxidoreductase [Ceratobasidium sp. AG-Ba]|nr:Flavin containing amine oxidoreductase [Ceratobasidium sp. AG-Ba]